MGAEDVEEVGAEEVEESFGEVVKFLEVAVLDLERNTQRHVIQSNLCDEDFNISVYPSTVRPLSDA